MARSATCARCRNAFEEAIGAEPLGGDVEEADIAAGDGVEDGRLLVLRDGGVDRRSSDPGRAEGVDLVLHQREQRGDDDGDAAVEEQGGHLVAEALAAAGGHDGESVPAREHAGDDLLLPFAEGVVAEDLGERLAGAVDGKLPAGGWRAAWVMRVAV